MLLGKSSAGVMQFHARWTECLKADIDIVETIAVSYVCHRGLSMRQEFPAGSKFPRRSIPCVNTGYLFIYLTRILKKISKLNDIT